MEYGFTLIEIMVALAVLALSGIALISNINQATRDLDRLGDKLIALNVAEYALNSVLVRKEFPDIGTEEEIITLANREWSVEVSVSETLNEDVRRIDALVRPYNNLLQRQTEATILLSAFQADIY